jgi:hypothetical protein
MFCNYGNDFVDAWVMKEYGLKESWNKLFEVSQSSLNRKFGHMMPLAYSKSGDEVSQGSYYSFRMTQQPPEEKKKSNRKKM